MNKIAIGTIIILIILLILFYNPVIFPLVNFTVSTYFSNVKPFLNQTLTWNPFPYTHLIISEIITWIVYIFTHKFPLAVLIFISILIMLLEIRWWKSG